MASDPVTQLTQSAHVGGDDQDKLELLGKLDDVVGTLANYAGVVTTAIQVIQAATSSGPNDSQVLDELWGSVQDLINISGVALAEVKMVGLDAFKTPALSDLMILSREGPNGQHVNPQQFFADALNYINTAADSDSWYRPFLPDRVYMPQVINNVANLNDPTDPGQQAGLIFPFTLGWYGTNTWDQNLPGLSPPVDTQHIEGYTTVLDPQFVLPAFLSAIEAILDINALLGQDEFNYFLSHYNDVLTSWANSLKSLYDLLINGLVKSDIPTADDIVGYLWIWGNIPSSGLTSTAPEGPCVWIKQPVGGAIEAANPDHSGCAWNGVYGVVDLYGVYEGPVAIPSHAASHIVDLFMSDGVQELSQDHPYLPGHAPYRWVRDRITLTLAARWKTIYVLRGYDKSWSLLQHLRAILKQQSDNMPALPDGTLARRQWSVRELIAALNLRPLWAETYPDYVAEPYYRFFRLVQRLDIISKGTWITPMDDDAFDNEERIDHTVVTERPVSFFDRLSAATL